ncbi:MAG: hypothetical protein PHT53_05900 [Candidatus Omnitrophica bacterium]|nr:hypothetical protein [Candidatus Omnitrophota bacterium]
MKAGYKGIVVYVIIAVLFNIFAPAVVYSYGSKQCSCCATSDNHSKAKCHDTRDVCFCKHVRIVQAIVPQAGSLNYRIFCGYRAPILHFSYRYLSIDDTFHPPKA